MSEFVPFESMFALPLRNGVSYPSRLRGTGTQMVNMREIFAYDRIGNHDCERAPLTDKELETYSLAPLDLLFARQSLTFEGAGKCSIFLGADEARTWESHLIRVRLDRSEAIPHYYYYYFKSPAGRRSIETIVQQVAAAGVRGSDLARLMVPKPSLSDQNAIAEVLTALDEKIGANAKLADLADELVRAEYARLGQGSSETVSIGSIATNPRDLVDPSMVDETMIYVGLEHVPRRRMWLSWAGSSREVTSTKASFARGDVLFGKLRPYFHKVVSAPTEGICSTDILVLRAKDADLTGFLLAATANDTTIQRCTAASEGTRMPRTSWRDLAAVEIPWPGVSAAESFSAKVAALRDRVESALAENRRLAATRDALLPPLMSKAITVKDAEHVLEGVV